MQPIIFTYVIKYLYFIKIMLIIYNTIKINIEIDFSYFDDKQLHIP